MINLATEPVRSCPKPKYKRIKPNQRMKGAISPAVRQQVKERSNGYCEVKQRCNGTYGVHMAHVTSRRQLTERTTAKDLLHACVTCHVWLDQSIDGIKYKREWVTHERGSQILHKMP